MGSATVTELSRKAAETERQEIINRFSRDRSQLEALATADVLNADEYQALRRLQELDWLLLE